MSAEFPEHCERLLDIFLDYLPKQMHRLEQAAKTGDLQEIGDVAHTLKSRAANVGAMRLAEQCGATERQARAANAGVAPALRQVVQCLLNEARTTTQALVVAPSGTEEMETPRGAHAGHRTGMA